MKELALVFIPAATLWSAMLFMSFAFQAQDFKSAAINVTFSGVQIIVAIIFIKNI